MSNEQIRNCSHIDCADHPTLSNTCQDCAHFRSGDPGVVPVDTPEIRTLSYALPDGEEDLTFLALKNAVLQVKGIVGFRDLMLAEKQARIEELQDDYTIALVERDHIVDHGLALITLLRQIESEAADGLSWLEHFGFDKFVSKKQASVEPVTPASLESVIDKIDRAHPNESIKRLLTEVPIKSVDADYLGLEIHFDTTPMSNLYIQEESNVTKTSFFYYDRVDWKEIDLTRPS